MLNSSNRSTQPWRTLVDRLEKPLTGLLLTLGLATVGFPSSPVRGSEVNFNQATLKQTASVASILKQESQSQPLNDGVYLYGQSTQAEQIGSAYMVFEVKQGEVVGAFYMPRSSFDCFFGEFEADKLALTVVDSYEQTQHPYAVALETPDPIAMAQGGTIAPVSFEGFHRLDNVSANDQQILSTCKADRSTQN